MKTKFYILSGVFLLLAAMFSPLVVRGNAGAAPSIAITSPTANQAVTNGSLTVQGTATPNTSVVVYNGAKPLKWVISDGSGNWSANITGLPNGNVTLTAKAISNGANAYFGAISGLINISQLRLSDNALNQGSGWPLLTINPWFLASQKSPSNDPFVYLTVLNDPTSPPGRFDITNPAEPTGSAGYPASPPDPSPFVGAFNATGTKYYSVNSGLNNVSVLDVAASTQLSIIPVGDTPQTAARGSDGRIYVSNAVGSSVSVIDPQTDTVVNTIAVTCPGGGGVGTTAFPEGESYFYLACAQSGEILRFSLSGSLLGTYDISSQLGSISTISITPDNKRLYASGNFGTAFADNIAVMNLDTHTIETVITLSADSIAAPMSPDGQYLYVSTQGSGFNTPNIDVVSTASNSVVDTIDTTTAGIPGILFFAESSTATASAPIRVNPSALADTGDSSFVVMLVAGSAVVASLLLIVLRRRPVAVKVK